MPAPILLTGVFLVLIFSCLFYGGIGAFAMVSIELAVAGLVLAWGMGMLWKREIVCVKTGFFIPFVLFAGYVVFQCLPLPPGIVGLLSAKSLWVSRNFIPGIDPAGWTTLSIYPYASFQEFVKIITYGGLFFLVINSVRQKKDAVFLANAIIWFGVLISIFAIIQHFSYANKVYWFDAEFSAATAVGPFVMKNNFTGYLCMIVPLAMGYMLTDMPFSRRVIYATGVAVMSLAMFFSLSRGGVIVYGLSMVIFLAVCASRTIVRQKPAFIFLCVIIGLCGALFLMEGRMMAERLRQLFQEEVFVSLGHGYSWADILRIIRDYIFVGSGLGTFLAISPMYKSTFIQDLFTYAHNDYLQFFSEAGIAGCCIAAWFVWRYVFSILKAWLVRRDMFVISLGLGGMVAFTAIMIYSLLDFNLHIPSHGILCAVIMGLTYRVLFLHGGIPVRRGERA
ncbi:MAG TPA: O-antigen ligase family protein [Candidatus Omnitrophota bacterium]|nr:O-antigen ligase family protein [Candidatus Omnitrophota bacterium]